MQVGKQPGRECGGCSKGSHRLVKGSPETVCDLVGFGKPLECLKQWDDNFCFHLTTQARKAGHRQTKGCFEAAQLIWGIAGPKTPAEVFAVTDTSNIVLIHGCARTRDGPSLN